LANGIKNGIQAISVGMKEKEFDETEASQAYADFIKGNFVKTTIEPNFNLSKLDELLLHFDQPFSDTSLIPVYYLSKLARKGTKVIIGGDGGDELFNGYSFMNLSYKLSENRLVEFCFKIVKIFHRLYPSNLKRKLNRLNSVIGKDISTATFNINSWIPIDTEYNSKSIFKYDTKEVVEYNNRFLKEKAESKAGKIIRYNFRKVMLSDYLRKTDMMSMLNSLEWRVPLLDEDLCNLAFSYSFSKKSTLMKTKIPLRKLHAKFFQGIGSNLSKKGFRMPLDVYLTFEEKRSIIKIISTENSYIQKYIENDYLVFLCDQFLKYTAMHLIERSAVYQRIIVLYSLQLWYNQYAKK